MLPLTDALPNYLRTRSANLRVISGVSDGGLRAIQKLLQAVLCHHMTYPEGNDCLLAPLGNQTLPKYVIQSLFLPAIDRQFSTAVIDFPSRAVRIELMSTIR